MPERTQEMQAFIADSRDFQQAMLVKMVRVEEKVDALEEKTVSILAQVNTTNGSVAQVKREIAGLQIDAAEAKGRADGREEAEKAMLARTQRRQEWYRSPLQIIVMAILTLIVGLVLKPEIAKLLLGK